MDEFNFDEEELKRKKEQIRDVEEKALEALKENTEEGVDKFIRIIQRYFNLLNKLQNQPVPLEKIEEKFEFLKYNIEKFIMDMEVERIDSANKLIKKIDGEKVEINFILPRSADEVALCFAMICIDALYYCKKEILKIAKRVVNNFIRRCKNDEMKILLREYLSKFNWKAIDEEKDFKRAIEKWAEDLLFL